MDLAGSTELGLCNGLTENGNSVHIISPDEVKIDAIPLHTNVNQIPFRGLQSISNAMKMGSLISKNNHFCGWADIFLVDWRLVGPLWKKMERMGIKWWIIDRGPPAYRGIFAKAQSLQWRRAWEIAARKAVGGFVVSRLHGDFVRERIGGGFTIIPIPAGTNIENCRDRILTEIEPINFVYSGVLEKRRDIRGIFRLLDYFHLLGQEGKITIIGDGVESKFVQKMALSDERVTYCGKLEHGKVINELNKGHVGILPMPPEMIWRMASPLKLAEYLAAGMIIIGPKHEGNSIEGEFEWDLLSDDGNWQYSGIESIRKLMDSGEWGNASKKAFLAAEKHLSWQKISSLMEDSLMI